MCINWCANKMNVRNAQRKDKECYCKLKMYSCCEFLLFNLLQQLFYEVFNVNSDDSFVRDF